MCPAASPVLRPLGDESKEGARTPPLLSRFKDEGFKREKENRNSFSLLWFFGYFLSIQKVTLRSTSPAGGKNPSETRPAGLTLH